MSLTPTPADPIKRKYYQDKLTREFYKDFYYDSDRYMHERGERAVVRIAARRTAPTTAPRTGHRQRSEGTRSSAASGDGNSDPDPDPERHAQPYPSLYDQSALAAFLRISKKTLQNLYSVAPHTLPVAIAIPGARGPRWTFASVQSWLSARPAHTAKPAPVAAKRKTGRPRIAAVAVKGVQS